MLIYVGPHEVAGDRHDTQSHYFAGGLLGLVFFHTRSLLIASAFKSKENASAFKSKEIDSAFKSKEIETADGIAVNDGLTQEVCMILPSADPVWLLQGSSQILVPVA